MDPVAGIEDCSCLVAKGISTGAAADRKHYGVERY